MILLLFNRFRKITDRCLELGAKMDTLTNEEVVELRRLLEEQAWLSKTIARQAQGVLEEVRQGLGRLEDWIGKALARVETALEEKGMPSDILALEEVMKQASVLRNGARNLISEKEGEQEKNGGETVREASTPGASAGADIRINLSVQDEVEVSDEVRAGVEEVASSAEGTAVLHSSEINGDGCEDPEKRDESAPKAPYLVQPDVSPVKIPEPVKYKLSRKIIDDLEEKLSPDSLRRNDMDAESMANVYAKVPNPKKKNKKSRRKKK